MHYTYASSDVQARTKDFIVAVFGYMSSALALTGLTALFISSSPSILNIIFRTPGIGLLLFVAQIGIVSALSLGIQRFSVPTLTALFYAYSALLGVVLSTLFIIYTMNSLYSAFFVCSAMFGIMALYGYFSKADLSSMRSILTMGLVGVMLASFANMLIRSNSVSFIINLVGVAVFLGLTAYDMQQLKMLSYTATTGNRQRLIIMGALKLYLNFINLFLLIVRLTGKKNNNER